MTLVIDASALVAGLVDDGPDGRWANAVLAGDRLVAPHLLPVEVANVLRRAVLTGRISADIGALAHADLIDLPIELFSYEPFGERVWELRASLTAYDAWYVALAETLEASLVTLDRRLASALGPRCPIWLPGA